MLPPVRPMVVYRGEQRWTAPLDVKELIRTPPPGRKRFSASRRVCSPQTRPTRYFSRETAVAALLENAWALAVQL